MTPRSLEQDTITADQGLTVTFIPKRVVHFISNVYTQLETLLLKYQILGNEFHGSRPTASISGSYKQITNTKATIS